MGRRSPSARPSQEPGFGCGGGLGEGVGRLEQDEGRAGDQVVRLQQPVNRGFRDKVLLLVGIRQEFRVWASG
jgi:hypothetical protein